MHILLTDRLSCPRCGPEFGLILLAHHIQDRRVLEGELGCPNCRELFHVDGGAADLRWPPVDDDPDATAGATRVEATEVTLDAEPVFRLAALLGITGGPGYVLLSGDAWVWARGLASMLTDIEWVTEAAGAGKVAELEGVSRVVSTPERLPFFGATFRGVVLESGDSAPLSEAARVLAPGARAVILNPGQGARERLAQLGLEVLTADASALVARRAPPGGIVASTSAPG